MSRHTALLIAGTHKHEDLFIDPAMPVIYRYNGFVFFFYSSDRPEPRHVHVRKGDGVAKFWLEPVELVKSAGFRPSQLSEIRAIIEQNYENFIKQWNRYFG